MARKKEYKEEEVIEKAMDLFWRNGYESTSVRMLEKEMGINQFSIYSSFGNKKGVFLKSLNCYKKKAKLELIDKLKNSSDGIESIKQYFYDFINFSKDIQLNKGCLITNTVNELGEKADKEIISEILNFAASVKKVFIQKLESNSLKTTKTINKQANYLMISLQGLSVASKMFDQEQLNDFIESTFKNL
ncbi:TetR/AcrR family transcriptional regulator [Pontimicrobium aquaticum]|uniref:TetR/AcrR family transcriptional regulator n=1 Tax=Pontimicrobium aquaticum TaxID=2565367 RepID=A0A4U0F146_9FLAO|nr:TetR/AcrR family transcriptional regulator [Pontimicrobium aquaticum]TJY38155.1 TetR/AcrR family transcriptional regulator [Pontimicrobium aquaticum]